MGKTNTGWSRVVENKMLYPVLFESELIAEANKYGMGDNVISETFTDGNESFDYITKSSNIICDAKNHCIRVKDPMPTDPTWVNKETTLKFSFPTQDADAPYNSILIKIDSTANLAIRTRHISSGPGTSSTTWANYTKLITRDISDSTYKITGCELEIAFLSPGEIKGIGIAFK